VHTVPTSFRKSIILFMVLFTKNMGLKSSNLLKNERLWKKSISAVVVAIRSNIH
jgi:hypothetical protein